MKRMSILEETNYRLNHCRNGTGEGWASGDPCGTT